jgi:PelA/Pel-15E family pectate lyase
MKRFAWLVMAVVAVVGYSSAQSEDPSTGRDDWQACFRKPAEWYGSAEAIRIAENVLLYQRSSGGWPKNIEIVKPLSENAKTEIAAAYQSSGSTIDNGATYSQIRYLLRVAGRTNEKRFAGAARKGLEYLLTAQYANGGWPQFYPLRKGYYTHITFNDDAIVGVLNLFYDIVYGSKEALKADEDLIPRLRSAIEKGVECILRCQIKRDGVLSVWCAQHDEGTFEPAQARAYELPSLSGKESVGVVEFLMRIDHPSNEIVDAVQAAVRWFHRSRVLGIKVVEEPDPSSPSGKNKVVITDSTAPPLWGRFYDLETNEVFYCSRDGVKKQSMAEISTERRNHYGWLGDWPRDLLKKMYPKWQKTWAPKENVLDEF